MLNDMYAAAERLEVLWSEVVKGWRETVNSDCLEEAPLRQTLEKIREQCEAMVCANALTPACAPATQPPPYSSWNLLLLAARFHYTSATLLGDA